METERVINLCDRDFKYIEDIYKNNAYSDLAIAIGSYSCPNYFLEVLNGNIGFSLYDLVIPVFSEHLLDLLDFEKLNIVCKKARNIVVNDIGFLSYFRQQAYDNIRLGRLFFREYKDHRYEEYHNLQYDTKISEVIAFLKENNFEFSAVEIDLPTLNAQIDVNCKVFIHIPYRQISISHICEYASIGKNIENKYIPDDNCGYQCFNQFFEYPVSGYLKIGRNVFDYIDTDLAGVKGYNIIETPRW